MRITRQMQIDLYAYNAGVIRSREDYLRHPNEFGKRKYCSACFELAGTATKCDTCKETRAKQRQRARRAA